ncbi:hypothetical protein J4526_01775 [Desulfurococcaceae archaeon MEX13E-LK6-19]|nr:hypothetical protein J4526_01775 [Desulfurococcaceae archaeon MEX13E-LK6-19]
MAKKKKKKISKKSKSKSKNKKSKDNGLFKPPRHKWLANIVSFKKPDEAKEAAQELVDALKKGRLGKKKIGRKTALTIARAIQYAANRAEAASKNPIISPKERRELKEVAEIYEDAAEEAWEIYREKYKED